MRVLILFLALSLSTALHGDPGVPEIRSITPDSGPVSGGTLVTIRGAGFSAASCPPGASCDPVILSFGGIIASNVRVVDDTTLLATTPVNLPLVVRVTVEREPYCCGMGVVAFTYTGSTEGVFDRLLVPIATASQGAFRSAWYPALNIVSTSLEHVLVFGVRVPCSFPVCYTSAVPFASTRAGFLQPVTSVAAGPAFMFVPKERVKDLSALLRVMDASRQEMSWGATIPIAHEREFTSDRIVLGDIPWSSRFRLNLRIYGLTPGEVRVKMYRPGPDFPLPTETVVALSSPQTLFDAPNATITAFGDGGAPFNVIVEPITPGLKIWAFISATNNETQHVTVIAPTTFRALGTDRNPGQKE